MWFKRTLTKAFWGYCSKPGGIANNCLLQFKTEIGGNRAPKPMQPRRCVGEVVKQPQRTTCVVTRNRKGRK